MKTIIVAYWMGTKSSSMKIEHKTVFEYSLKKRNEIIKLVLENKLQVMMYKNNDQLVMWIDNGRFRQR